VHGHLPDLASGDRARGGDAQRSQRMAEMTAATEDLDTIWERPWKMGANVLTRMVGAAHGAGRGAGGAGGAKRGAFRKPVRVDLVRVGRDRSASRRITSAPPGFTIARDAPSDRGS
jgi:hypothetical protein